MKFEYDKAKSASNKKKHGIDFIKAQLLWLDDYRLEVVVPYNDEERFAVIGIIDEKCWVAIVTYRKDNIRIISVRRAREKEIFKYEEETH